MARSWASSPSRQRAPAPRLVDQRLAPMLSGLRLDGSDRAPRVEEVRDAGERLHVAAVRYRSIMYSTAAVGHLIWPPQADSGETLGQPARLVAKAGEDVPRM
jgi:hypothetical protein